METGQELHRQGEQLGSQDGATGGQGAVRGQV